MEMILGGRKTETIQNYETVVSAWYDAYGTDILRYCFMMLGNRTDAEDATQETFLKAWRNIGRYEARNGCSPKSWIIRIAGNTCRDQLRKPFRRFEDRTVRPEDLGGRGELSPADRELRIDLARLPEEYRTPVRLVYGRGLTVQETAARVRVSKATISRRLQKARGIIRRSMLCTEG